MIKVGDVVKVLSTETRWLGETIGEQGVVKRIETPHSGYPDHILVEFICDYSGNNKWYYLENELEVIKC